MKRLSFKKRVLNCKFFSKPSLSVFLVTLIFLFLVLGCGWRSPEKIKEEAEQAFFQRDLSTAMLKWEEFLQRYPNHPYAVEAQYNLSMGYLWLGQYEKAIEEFKKVTEYYSASHPLVVDAFFKIGIIYSEMKQPEKAIAQWEKIQQQYSDQSAVVNAALFNLARTYQEQKKYKLALETYRKTLDRIPSADTTMIVQTLMEIARCYRDLGNRNAALAWYSELGKRFGPSSDSYIQDFIRWSKVEMADIYKKSRENKKANKLYLEALNEYQQLSTDTVGSLDRAIWAMTKMAEVYIYHTQETTKGIETYRMITTKFPDNPSWTPRVRHILQQFSENTVTVR